MGVVEFFKDVLPSRGHIAIGRGRGGPFNTCAVRPGADVLKLVAKARQTPDVDYYFTPASYGDEGLNERKLKGFRTSKNCIAKRCFAIDIDLNHEKRPSYKLKSEALVGLAYVIRSISMPKPTYIVDSGRGIHVYWCFGEDVAPERWTPVASALKAKLIEADAKLMVDPTRAADLAGYLRMPGSWNTRNGGEVKILSNGQTTPFSEFESLAGLSSTSLGFDIAPSETAPRRSLAAVQDDSRETTYVKEPIKLIAQCPPMARLAVTHTLQSYDAWQGVARVFARSEDKDAGLRAFTLFSRSHPQFDEKNVRDKFANAVDTSFASPTCAQMRSWAELPPAACRNCPLYKQQGENGKPAALQCDFMDAPAAPMTPADDDTEPEHLARIRSGRAGRFVPFSMMGKPLPYIIKRNIRARDSGLFTSDAGHMMLRVVSGDQENPQVDDLLVGQYPIWVEDIVSERRDDGQLGSGVRIGMGRKNADDEWEVRYVTIRREAFNQGGSALLAELSDLRSGLVVATTRDSRWIALHNALVKQYAKTPAEKHVQKAERYGWYDIDDPQGRSFVVGDRRYGTDGSVQLIEQAHNARSFNKFVPQRGKLSVAKINFASVFQQAEFEAQFAMLLSIGTPLVALTNVAGALYYMDGGTGMGKTLLMHYCSSFYGTPALDGLPARGEDTKLSIPHMMGTASAIPFMIDELTDMDSEDLSSFVMSVTNGRERNRLQASVNALRETSEWKIIAIASSNKSLASQLSRFDAATEARFARSIVVSLDREGLPGRLFRNGVDPIVARIEEAKEHHGVLGPAFVKYVLKNFDAVKRRIKDIDAKIRNGLGLLSSGDRDHMRVWRMAGVVAIVTAEILAGGFGDTKGMGILQMDTTFTQLLRIRLEERAEMHLTAGESGEGDNRAQRILADFVNQSFSMGEGAVYEFRDASGELHEGDDVVRKLSAVSATHYPRRNAAVGLYLKEGDNHADMMIRTSALRVWCGRNDVDMDFLLQKLRGSGMVLKSRALGNPSADVSLPSDPDKVSTVTGSVLPPTNSVLVRWQLRTPFDPKKPLDWEM